MIRLPDAAATEALGVRIGTVARPGDTVSLSGPLGAGKTSLARGMLRSLGLQGEAPSPSFAIVQPYEPPEVRFPVAHIDLYRIEDPAEIEGLGLDEAARWSLTIVEWPDRAGTSAWPDALALTLVVTADGGRVLTARVPAAWEARWRSI